jgi:8-amino-7-oxononanoate synthase
MNGGFREELDALKAKGLYRSLRSMESAAGPRVVVEGREMLMCASNNYLGLASDPRLKRAAIEAIETWGTGSGGSRLTTGNLSLHERLEQRIAAFKQTEAAMVFNTGYMANVGLMTALGEAGDVIFSDALNHASIIDGCRLSRADVVIYRHADVEDLAWKLSESGRYRRKIIVTDGVFSMDGDIAPLPALIRLAEQYDALLVVDDAHATGVLGRRGAGTGEFFGLSARIPVQMGTLSKAVGAEGGYVAGSRELIEYLRNRARPFIYSTALSPGVIAAALQAIDIVEKAQDRRETLDRLSGRLRDALSRLGYNVLPGVTPILAVVTGEAQSAVRLSKMLEERGIFAPAIRPPTVPPGSSRIRLTLMATHTESDVNQIIEAFRYAKESVMV